MAGGYSYNGWPASDSAGAIGVDTKWTINGITAPGGIKSGDVETVMTYVFDALDTRVEEAVPGWNWGWTYKANVNNPSQLSNHASATAFDYNAPYHPNGGAKYEGWSDAEVAEIRKILAEVENVVRWGADYNGTKDSMHFEINDDAGEVARVAAKIRDMEDNMGKLSADDIDAIAKATVKQLMGTAVPQFGDPAHPGQPVNVSFQNFLPKLGNWAAVSTENTNELLGKA
jgi:D-alanyl-D-alanine carboxypeptidase